MAVVKLDELSPMIEAGKAINSIVNNPANEDGIARIERIINGVRELAQVYLQARGQNPPAQAQADVIINQPPPQGNLPLPPQARPPQLPAPKNEKGNEMLDELIKAVEEHILKCYAENPEMPVSEIINKLPYKAEDLKNLLMVYKVAKKMKLI